MTRSAGLRKVRRLLVRRRRELVEATLATREELGALDSQERDPELEEGAQTELASHTLSQLLEGQRRQILLVDQALQRLDQNAFGICTDCGAPISIERLLALPFAVRCEEDAARHELELELRSRAHPAPSL